MAGRGERVAVAGLDEEAAGGDSAQIVGERNSGGGIGVRDGATRADGDGGDPEVILLSSTMMSKTKQRNKLKTESPKKPKLRLTIKGAKKLDLEEATENS